MLQRGQGYHFPISKSWNEKISIKLSTTRHHTEELDKKIMFVIGSIQTAKWSAWTKSLFSSKIYFVLKRKCLKTGLIHRFWLRPMGTESIQWPFSAESVQHQRDQQSMPLVMGGTESATSNWHVRRLTDYGKPMKCSELKSKESAKARTSRNNQKSTASYDLTNQVIPDHPVDKALSQADSTQALLIIGLAYQ